VSSVVMLPYALSSVAIARQRLSADLLAYGVFAAVVDDVVLVMSELMSNSLRHAHPLPSGLLRVSWDCSDIEVEVAVSDGGATTEPRAARAALSSLGGRGLGIVEFLADRWGVRHDGELTTVWAVLPTAPDVPNQSSDMSEMSALREVG
jgi:anti-sigma regulatory factor (Ser/Thr protein kinase)